MKSHNYIIYILMVCSLTAAWIATGCGAAPSERPIVTVSIEPQRYILEQITGDRVQVRSLLTEGANPETYDPSVTHMHNLGKSLGYLRMGNIGFEAALIDKISEANPDLKIFDTSAGVTPILGTHSHGHEEHSTVDPHTWTSVKNAKIIARNMLQAMEQIDSANKEYYSANYERFITHLDSLDNAITVSLTPHRGESFMVWHPSLSYFARDYGLNQVVVGNAEHKDNSVNDLRGAIDHARETGARIFFFQKDIDSRQVSAINSELQSDEVNINPLSYQWEEEIIRIADALAGRTL
ncbi:MAG: zinc ABC transporter substrate-binding protein [Duncaniella sp.]|nr:zinc ABC transporter solute-binding protein [Bacteroides sp.]MDE6037420.1 zinc ABC transporter substrate-binding protein [Duncaniella sp.]